MENVVQAEITDVCSNARKKNLKCSFFSKYSAVGVETRGEWVKYEVCIKCKGQCKTLTSNRKGH